MVVKGNTFPDRKTTPATPTKDKTMSRPQYVSKEYTLPGQNTGSVLDTSDVHAETEAYPTPRNGVVTKTVYTWSEEALSLGLLSVNRDPSNLRNYVLALYLMEDNTAVLKTVDGTYCAHMVFAPSYDPTKFADVGIVNRYRGHLRTGVATFASGFFYEMTNALRMVGDTQTRIPVVPTNIWADVLTQLSVFMAEGGLNT